jgi:cyanate permease
MASAVMGIAISFGFSYSPKIFDDLINLYGWQHAWMLIAFVVGIIFVIFALITFRDDPSKYGLVPDGKEIFRKERGDHKFKPTKDFALSEARSTFNFWIFNLTLAMQALYITALTFNIVDIFKTAGLTRDDAILIFLPTSIVAVLFQMSGGYLADFIKLKYLLMVQLIGMIISMVGLTILAPGLPLYLIIFGNGIAGGLFGVISTVAWPRFYGTKNLGAISGFSMSWVVAGSAIGPYLFSVLYNFNNSYSHVGRLLLVMTGLLLFLSIKIKNQNVLIND